MLNTLIVGASGYAGAELTAYLNRHPHMNITALAVSAQSADAGKLLSDLHPQLKGIVDLPLQPLTDVAKAAQGIDVVFLATAHEVSHDIADNVFAIESRWYRDNPLVIRGPGAGRDVTAGAIQSDLNRLAQLL